MSDTMIGTWERNEHYITEQIVLKKKSCAEIVSQRRQARKSMITIQCSKHYARDMLKDLWEYTGGHTLKHQDMSPEYINLNTKE